jgi:2-polyprenyl-3-methyl-5-hydroxy-6-metoxy-1,4-benzoquinol methylase
MRPSAGRDYFSNVWRDVLHVAPGRLGHVLDIGGGTGVTARMLKEEGRAASATVADLFAEAPVEGIDRFVKGDANDPAFLRDELAPLGPFDTVMCLDVLEHLVDPWRVVRDAAGMLRPGGHLIASLPNVRFVSLLFPLVVKGRFDYRSAGVMDRTHLRWFTRSTAIEMLSVEGLTLQKVHGNLGTRSARLNALTFSLARDFFVFQYLFCLRKGSPPPTG